MKIKTDPDDFIVEEQTNHAFSPSDAFSPGIYGIYLVEKKNWNTENVAQLLAKKVKLSRKSIGYAGNKDKHAHTYQYFSIKLASKHTQELLNTLELSNITLTFKGYSKEAIHLGDLDKNTFTVIVRDLEKKLPLAISQPIKNLFGEQRYSKNNIAIGRALVQQNFQEACTLLKLQTKNNDFVGALRATSLRMLRFYVAAYQSYLWDTIAIQINSCENNTLPIPGFLTTIQDSSLLAHYTTLFTQEQISFEHFYIKPFKELSHEGNTRQLFITPENISAEWNDDTHNPPKKQCMLHFTLPKGSYATTVIAQLFAPFGKLYKGRYTPAKA